MHNEIIAAISAASSLEQEAVAKILTEPKDLEHGDFAFPCFVLAKEWKCSPAECAKRLGSCIKLPEGVDRAEVSGPYLNFRIKRTPFAERVINEILDRRLDVGRGSQADRTVVLEYSSPNIAKPFHVGHLRPTAIGHALDRIYRHLGYNVISINHLGDWGTQFGFVYAGFKLWGGSSARQDSVFSLVDWYVKACTLRESQEKNEVAPEDAGKPNVGEMARDYFRRLESNEKEALEFWHWCLDISMQYLRKIYARIGVVFDFYTGESFYRDKLKKVEDDIRQSGILVDSRGALGVDMGKKLGFVRVFAEDGRSLYICRDLAAADYRYTAYRPSKIVYVVGAPQTLYFQQFFGVLRGMKHPAADLVVHVPFGNVPGISTRGGAEGQDKLWLQALLDEAHERALDAYRNQVAKRPAGVDEEAVAEAVGLGAVFFNYLSRSNLKEFNFSWEEALNFQGDTGPYVQYALARLHSIEAKAAAAGISVEGDFDAALLQDDQAHRIVSLLSRFHATVVKAAADYEPYYVASYVLELSKAFSTAYNSVRVVGQEEKLAKARLALFRALKYVLHVGLTLIGVPPVERM